MRNTSLVTSRLTNSAIRAVSRWVLGAAGILWVAMAASLCGCSPVSPVNGWVMNESGQSYYKRGEYAKARYEFERALMDRPYSADYAFNVAAAMDQQGDHLAAEKMYRHALTLDPGHQPAYHGMAAMLMEEGRTPEAEDLLNTWAVTQPYSPEAATELGWLKGEQGDIEGADRELRRALRQNPRHTGALTQLGRVHGKAGRRSDAAADFARSLYMDPNQPEAQAELAALSQGGYGDPALQMAATLPLYDPDLQPGFTAPQTQMAGVPTSHQGWTGTLPVAPMGASQSPAQGVTFSQPTGQTGWSQPQPPQMMYGQPTYPTPASPGAVSTPYASPQFYNTARPTTSFFQPQQSFNGSSSGEALTSTPMPTPATTNDAPTWNAPPTMNASFGTAIPAEQMSSVPVVPAF